MWAGFCCQWIWHRWYVYRNGHRIFVNLLKCYFKQFYADCDVSSLYHQTAFRAVGNRKWSRSVFPLSALFSKHIVVEKLLGRIKLDVESWLLLKNVLWPRNTTHCENTVQKLPTEHFCRRKLFRNLRGWKDCHITFSCLSPLSVSLYHFAFGSWSRSVHRDPYGTLIGVLYNIWLAKKFKVTWSGDLRALQAFPDFGFRGWFKICADPAHYREFVLTFGMSNPRRATCPLLSRPENIHERCTTARHGPSPAQNGTLKHKRCRCPRVERQKCILSLADVVLTRHGTMRNTTACFGPAPTLFQHKP